MREADLLQAFLLLEGGMTKEYLTEREVAKLTGRALSTLRNDRAAARGFAYIKWGRFVRYMSIGYLS